MSPPPHPLHIEPHVVMSHKLTSEP
uniref:Uncharacterized protein n=1 Tax=Anguilla anguilla TaxID=7936 RepID=A0A0E9VRH6_ANGAN